jgi:hypothetical protein
MEFWLWLIVIVAVVVPAYIVFYRTGVQSVNGGEASSESPVKAPALALIDARQAHERTLAEQQRRAAEAKAIAERKAEEVRIYYERRRQIADDLFVQELLSKAAVQIQSAVTAGNSSVSIHGVVKKSDIDIVKKPDDNCLRVWYPVRESLPIYTLKILSHFERLGYRAVVQADMCAADFAPLEGFVIHISW